MFFLVSFSISSLYCNIPVTFAVVDYNSIAHHAIKKVLIIISELSICRTQKGDVDYGNPIKMAIEW